MNDASSGRRSLLGPGLAVLAGAAYGLFGRFVFGWPKGQQGALANVFAVMTLAFVFVVPIAVGALTVALTPPGDRDRPPIWIFLPWASCALMLVAAGLLLWEGAFCIVLAAPVFFILASVGGIVTGAVLQSRARTAARAALLPAVLLLPFALAPLELRTPPASVERLVRTETTIAARPATVWRNVVRVPEIRDDELSPGLFEAIGVPKPLEATLSRDGAGALRTARFRGGIVFDERIEVWEPERRLGFTIRVVPGSVAPEVLDEHVRVGGEHFDVTWGEFRLLPEGEGKVRLVLESRHRLSTRFNAYAGLWTDAIMADLQERICAVIRRRAEEAERPAPRGRP